MEAARQDSEEEEAGDLFAIPRDRAMTKAICGKPCECVCRQNHITWLDSEIQRLKREKMDKQRIIERLMESIPSNTPHVPTGDA